MATTLRAESQGKALTQQPEYRDLWGLIGLAGLAVLLVGLLIWLNLNWPRAVGSGNSSMGRDPMEGISQTAFTDETGIRIIRIFSTAGGGMIDLRYQVVDPDKAIIIHDSENPPVFINEATGQVIDRPYHDHSSRTTLRAGLTYNEILVNEGGVIKPGDLITVRIGQSRLEHVPVQ